MKLTGSVGYWFLWVSILSLSTGISFAESRFRLTVLYDNYTVIDGTQADWGFACLIEGTDKTILFDSGTKPEILQANVEKLGIDLSKVDEIIISHSHHDHTGGLSYVLPLLKDTSVFVPVSFPSDQASIITSSGAKIVRVSGPASIAPGVSLTGEMGDLIKEQSLILESENEMTIVTGCSHQGIVNILKKARELSDKPIELVFGGFHLLRHSEEQINSIIRDFQKIGVKKCGATHCTGEKAIELFKQAYQSDFVHIGVGKVIQVE